MQEGLFPPNRCSLPIVAESHIFPDILELKWMDVLKNRDVRMFAELYRIITFNG